MVCHSIFQSVGLCGRPEARHVLVLGSQKRIVEYHMLLERHMAISISYLLRHICSYICRCRYSTRAWSSSTRLFSSIRGPSPLSLLSFPLWSVLFSHAPSPLFLSLRSFPHLSAPLSRPLHLSTLSPLHPLISPLLLTCASFPNSSRSRPLLLSLLPSLHPSHHSLRSLALRILQPLRLLSYYQ